MAEEPVKDALGTAIRRGDTVQLAGSDEETGVVTATGGGTVGIDIGGRRVRYSRMMSEAVVTVISSGRDGGSTSGSGQNGGEDGPSAAVDSRGVQLQIGDGVRVAGSDFPYNGFVQSVNGGAVVIRASRGRNLSDVVRRYSIAAAAVLMTVTAAGVASRRAASVRQSRRLRGVPVEGPRDCRGTLLAVGDAVAVTQFVGGEPCECTGVVLHITTLYDTPQITIGYHTESAVMTFEAVRECVLRLGRPPDLCLCGVCTPDDGGGGLCSTAWDATPRARTSSDDAVDQGASAISAPGVCPSSEPHSAYDSAISAPSSADDSSCEDTAGSGVSSEETAGSGVSSEEWREPPSRTLSAGADEDGVSVDDRAATSPPPARAREGAPAAGSAARRRARAKHARRAGRRRRMRDGDAAAMAILGDNPPRLSDRQLTDRLRGRHSARRADLSSDDFVMADFFSGTKSMAMSAQRLYRTWAVTVDVQEAFSPDVVSDFLDFDLWGYFLEEFSFVAADGSTMVWIPLHFHLSPSCLTYSCGSGWLSGRSRLSPYADGLATEAAHNADACVVDIAELIRFMRSYGCVTTFTIENPGGSFLWRVLEGLLGDDLGGEGDEEGAADGSSPALTRTVVHYCAYGASFRKPTVIAHSPCLGRGWARKCDNVSGSCGAMRGGVHGSPGGFTLRDAGIPRALCDGLNLAWRAHHFPLRAENPLHGALPVETVLAMQEAWQQRRRHVGEAAPASSDGESVSSEYESPDSSDEGPAWDDGGELHFSEYDCLAGDVGAVLCERCSTELSPHLVSAPSVSPPMWPEEVVACGLCCLVPAEGELSIACEDRVLPSCNDCFLQHFAFQKGEHG